ncbi:uncharacterized protein N7511_003572 [Penicillium nucicola]|uniref:uncharacterized protein n=1 Tax=Penicillium nucicola TaxID=1850975 RepID=UPI002544DAE6|nr:uncharacterized protein N7511_011253 [Penicillium nucicola]XP_056988156.1 uncharacterized protein N7511_003572 [Penicillium nucicola]KAJ5742682.1 hypothetical protein N7511_011253 [Penicillium nucicola]KAJ5771521.1 hypothetical protein N7511_003572 [Penicillium nucicola]
MPQNILQYEGMIKGIGSLPGFSAEYIPFRAQHQILQVMQQQLEVCAFCFIQKWLLAESLAVGWTCPQALELHKVFRFLQAHREKVKDEFYQSTLSALIGWRGVITSIRHAAVHRISQHRKSLLELIRVAINFSQCTVGLEDSKSLCRLQVFVKTGLSEFDQRTAQLRQKATLQISLCEARPHHLGRRLALLPEAVIQVLQGVEDDFVFNVEQFLRAEFKNS